MATDRDRFARVVDKRFNPIAYLLEVGDASCVSRISEHILMRELEADPVLKTLFNQAHRVLSRADVPLIPGSDREAAQIAQEGLRSVPQRVLLAHSTTCKSMEATWQALIQIAACGGFKAALRRSPIGNTFVIRSGRAYRTSSPTLACEFVRDS